jgi:thioredoxin-related protein
MIKIIVLFLTFGFCFSSFSYAKDEIKQVLNLEYVSYEDSLVLAKEQNKKVFVFFTGEYCSWCQKQKDVLMEQDVLNTLKDHVICFVDLLERKDLAKKYNVKMVPAYFIIDSDEKLIKKHTGFKSSKDLISWIESKGWFR